MQEQNKTYHIYPTSPGLRSDFVKITYESNGNQQTIVTKRDWVSLLITMTQAIGLPHYEFITHDHIDPTTTCSEHCKPLNYGENLFSHTVLVPGASDPRTQNI